MTNFDPSQILFGGVGILVLVMGLVEFIKSLTGWDGPKVTALAVGLGTAFMLAIQISADYPIFQLWLTRVVVALAFGLAGPGYYKFINARAPATRVADDAYWEGFGRGKDAALKGEGVAAVVKQG